MENEQKNKLGDNITDAVDDVKEYVELRLRLIQLNVTEKVSVALAGIITGGVALLFFSLCFLFGSFAASYLIGEALDSIAAGFGIVAAFYLLIGLIVLKVSKGGLKEKLINIFIRQFNND